ncbi:MAG TPA: TetR/AcrR family transcriptional regulator [Vitreimonas sp.]|jgi:AcrR family transcriptional regulator|nr:TetR/AcrR family transcriptional regulator [Vitreimonas sp.]
MTAAKPEPRWRRRAEARPEEILEAALAEFNERGFEAARMEDIGKRAGLSKAGVYLYFPSKMALLEALIEARVSPLATQAQTLAQAGKDDPLAALRLLARVAAHRIADPNVFAVPRLVIGLSGRFPQIAEYYRTHVVEKARGALEALIDAAIAKQQIRAVDKGAVVRAFIGPMFFEAMWTHVLRGESALAEPEKLIEQHFDILLNGLERRA